MKFFLQIKAFVIKVLLKLQFHKMFLITLVEE